MSAEQSGASKQLLPFCERRKDLLPRLEESLMALRTWREHWQRRGPAQRVGCAEAKSLFQAIQAALVKVLSLDRENQQAL